MQRASNMWGRELRERHEASQRAMCALEENPKIKDLHVAITVYVPCPSDARRRVFYQVRWYDHAIAMKRFAEKHSTPKPCPTCGCEWPDWP